LLALKKRKPGKSFRKAGQQKVGQEFSQQFQIQNWAADKKFKPLTPRRKAAKNFREFGLSVAPVDPSDDLYKEKDKNLAPLRLCVKPVRFRFGIADLSAAIPNLKIKEVPGRSPDLLP
jgi:hypothetical protein